ncbi:hypothetical protein Tco_0409953 [Tanacetum coccineum]
MQGTKLRFKTAELWFKMSVEDTMRIIKEDHFRGTMQEEMLKLGMLEVRTEESNVSSVRNDALMSILDEMHEQGVQSMSANKQVKVVNDTLTSELARYKELVGVYEQWAKVEIEKVKEHYKELLESIKITRVSTKEKTSSLLTQIEDLKAQLEVNLKDATRIPTKPISMPVMYAIDVKPQSLIHLKNNIDSQLPISTILKESVETDRGEL